MGKRVSSILIRLSFIFLGFFWVCAQVLLSAVFTGRVFMGFFLEVTAYKTSGNF